MLVLLVMNGCRNFLSLSRYPVQEAKGILEYVLHIRMYVLYIGLITPVVIPPTGCITV